jgi:hypothetical protein
MGAGPAARFRNYQLPGLFGTLRIQSHLALPAARLDDHYTVDAAA